MKPSDRMLLSGNEAVALAANNAGVSLGTGYPGTPSTEILENFARYGGKAQWAPNEKIAYEVGLGVAFAGGRALVTMKHVGLNVAADPFFTSAYTGVTGAFVLISADDPGMASSQNEQDNRRYAVAAGIPMLEPADSQEAYDFTATAIEISEKWQIPVMLRMTTRVCHSKTIVQPHWLFPKADPAWFRRDIKSRVMIPAYARPAHRRLREKLEQIANWNETADVNRRVDGSKELGIITSGIAYMHVREAAPDASVLKLGCSYPLPMEKIRDFGASVERCIVIEEGDPYLVEQIRTAGVEVESKPEMYRFGELNVPRVRRILAGDTSEETNIRPGKPPELCKGCPYRPVFNTLRNLDCIVAGDIGCYTLGVLSPFEAMDTCVCMGASITVGLGMRHVLPPDQARRVISVIGDSTFIHSGVSGMLEMVYNPPPTGHVVLMLDNGTTAMTGQQEHPGTGRTLEHLAANKIDYEAFARSIGIDEVHIFDVPRDPAGFEKLLQRTLAAQKLSLIIARRACILAAGKIKEYEQAIAQKCSCTTSESTEVETNA